MAREDRPRRSRSGRLLDALIWGVLLGAAGGAVLGAAIGGVGTGVGAVIGSLLYAPAEMLTTLRRMPAEPKPIWRRIFASALLVGPGTRQGARAGASALAAEGRVEVVVSTGHPTNPAPAWSKHQRPSDVLAVAAAVVAQIKAGW